MLRSTQPGRLRRRLMNGYLMEHVSAVTGQRPEFVGVHTPLVELGLSSEQIARLGRRIESDLGVTVSPTAGWQYPTVEKLGDYLARCLDIDLDGTRHPRPARW